MSAVKIMATVLIVAGILVLLCGKFSYTNCIYLLIVVLLPRIQAPAENEPPTRRQNLRWPGTVPVFPDQAEGLLGLSAWLWLPPLEGSGITFLLAFPSSHGANPL
jgi:hypothetical protein